MPCDNIKGPSRFRQSQRNMMQKHCTTFHLRAGFTAGCVHRDEPDFCILHHSHSLLGQSAPRPHLAVFAPFCCHGILVMKVYALAVVPTRCSSREASTQDTALSAADPLHVSRRFQTAEIIRITSFPQS